MRTRKPEELILFRVNVPALVAVMIVAWTTFWGFSAIMLTSPRPPRINPVPAAIYSDASHNGR